MNTILWIPGLLYFIGVPVLVLVALFFVIRWGVARGLRDHDRWLRRNGGLHTTDVDPAA